MLLEEILTNIASERETDGTKKLNQQISGRYSKRRVYNTETELLFNFFFFKAMIIKIYLQQGSHCPCWIPWRNDKKGPFWYHSGKSKSNFTKASARLEIDRLQVSLSLVRWDKHSSLCTMGHGSRHGIVLHLYTQKLLSESKLTKQEQLLFLYGFLWSMCSHLKSWPMCHLLAFKVICIALVLQSNSQS